MAKYHAIPEQKTLWQNSVIDKDLTAPPVGPIKGDRYLIYASSPTGSWEGHGGDIAYYDGSAWQFITKKEGMHSWVKDEDKVYVYDGANWFPESTATGISFGTLANRPVAGNAGRIYIVVGDPTSNNNGHIWLDTGTGWVCATPTTIGQLSL